MIVAGGGTGGHLFPGLAVADAAAARAGTRVLFVGSAYGLEAHTIPATPYPFHALGVRGVRGRGIRGIVTLAWELPRAIRESWRILGRFRPTLVLGLGGYGSVPVAITAWLRRVPLVLLEQNAYPGFANRLLGRLARTVCTTYAESAAFFPAGKAMHTGNPVRQLTCRQHPLPNGFTLFAFGGSQGAHSINLAMLAAAPILGRQLSGLRILHQTGAADAPWVRQAYEAAGIEADVREFVADMGEAYGRADLVVCRAGATTLAELSAVGKASILIPYPFAADDHQRRNAEIFVAHGAAEMILNADLNGERLAQAVAALARDGGRRTTMSACARGLAVPDATARVVTICRQVAGET